jgi:hypothetical protein
MAHLLPYEKYSKPTYISIFKLSTFIIIIVMVVFYTNSVTNKQFLGSDIVISWI